MKRGGRKYRDCTLLVIYNLHTVQVAWITKRNYMYVQKIYCFFYQLHVATGEYGTLSIRSQIQI